MFLITRVLEYSLTTLTGSFTCNINSLPSPQLSTQFPFLHASGPQSSTILRAYPSMDFWSPAPSSKSSLLTLVTCNVRTLPVDWDQYYTVLIIQSLVVTPAQYVREQDTGISHTFASDYPNHTVSIFGWLASSSSRKSSASE